MRRGETVAEPPERTGGVRGYRAYLEMQCCSNDEEGMFQRPRQDWHRVHRRGGLVLLSFCKWPETMSIR